jgi:hypothetical protein
MRALLPRGNEIEGASSDVVRSLLWTSIMSHSPSFDRPFDPEDPKPDRGHTDDDDRIDELDERVERDLFDSPSDSWRELEDLEQLMELDDEEPTGKLL